MLSQAQHGLALVARMMQHCQNSQAAVQFTACATSGSWCPLSVRPGAKLILLPGVVSSVYVSSGPDYISGMLVTLVVILELLVGGILQSQETS